MKRTARIFTLLLVLTLSLAAIMIAASADGASDTTEPSFNGALPESVTIDPEIEAQLLGDGFACLKFETEEEFLKALEGGYDELSEYGLTSFVPPSAATKKSYIYLLKDTAAGMTTPSVDGAVWIFNLGDHSITYSSAGATCAHVYSIAYINGEFIDTKSGGHAALRNTGTLSLTLRDVDVTMGSRTFSSETLGSITLYAENVNFYSGVGEDFIWTGGVNSVATNNRGAINLILKNVDSDCAFISLNNYTADASLNARACSVYISGRCSLAGLMRDNRVASVKSNLIPVTVAMGSEIGAATLASVSSAPASLSIPEGMTFVDNGDATCPLTLTTPPATLAFTPSSELKAANGNFVVYKSTMHFLRDLDEGIIDGVDKDGVNLIVSNASDGLPSSGFVCMFADYRHAPTSALTVGANEILSINMLTGKTYTEAGIGSGNNAQSSLIVSGNFNFYGGTLLDPMTGKLPTVTVNAGATVTIKNATVKTSGGWEGTDATFFSLKGATVNVENSEIIMAGSQTSVFNSASSTSTINLVGVTMNDTAASHNNASHPAGFINLKNKASAIVNVDSTSKVIRGQLINSWPSYTSGTFTVNLELGFSVADPARLLDTSLINSAAHKINYIENGKIVKDGVTFGISGSMYVLQRVIYVYWYGIDGKLDHTDPLFVGSIPSASLSGDIYEVRESGVYILDLVGWSDTKGGSAIELTAIKEGEIERHYYPVASADGTPAAIAAFDRVGGKVLSAWETPVFTEAQLNSLPAGGALVFYTDIDFDPGNTDKNSTRLTSWKDGITVDLGGYTLTHTKEGNSCKRWSGIAGQTITIMNGTMKAVGNDNIFESSAAGAVMNFYNVHFIGSSSTAWPIADWRDGEANIYGGSASTPSAFFSLQAGGTTPNIKVSIYGTDIDCGASPVAKIYAIASTLATDTAAAVVRTTNISFSISDYDGAPTRVKASAIVDHGSLLAMGENSRITVSAENVFALLSSSPFTFVSSKWATWYDADTNSFVTNTDLEKSNITHTVSNLYTNKEIAAVKNATITINGVKQSITSEGGYTVAYTEMRELGLLANLTLYSDFNLNLYIPKNVGVTKVTLGQTVLFDINDPTTYREWNEDTYVFSVYGIAPNCAAKALALAISYADVATLPGDEEPSMIIYSAEFSYSVVEYICDAASVTGASEATVNAMKAMAVYIKETYSFFTSSQSDADIMESLDDFIEAYSADGFVSDFEVVADPADTDFGATLGVLCSFEVSARTRLHVTLTADDAYAITDSKGNVLVSGYGDGFILDIPAYMLSEVFTIYVGGASATFSYAEYADALIGDSYADDDAALRALYAYAMTAAELKRELMPDGTL